MKEITVANDLTAAKETERRILGEANACGYSESDTFAVKLALEEALTNAFRHGNKCDPSKNIVIRYQVTDERIVIEVCDEGNGFALSSVPDPTLPQYINRPHGRGIMLMKAYLDEVSFSGSDQEQSWVRLVKLNN